eukprot:COSAG04_NODE_5_length_50521_cov_24.772639_49_plen_183_part_00
MGRLAALPLLLLLPDAVRAHGSMTFPRPRNAADAQLSPWRDWASPPSQPRFSASERPRHRRRLSDHDGQGRGQRVEEQRPELLLGGPHPFAHLRRPPPPSDPPTPPSPAHTPPAVPEAERPRAFLLRRAVLQRLHHRVPALRRQRRPLRPRQQRHPHARLRLHGFVYKAHPSLVRGAGVMEA